MTPKTYHPEYDKHTIARLRALERKCPKTKRAEKKVREQCRDLGIPYTKP